MNRHTKAGLDYLEIIIEPYPYPISYRGQYHYRSGSTKQELKGAALDKFLLQKQGKRWDGVPVPGITAADLDAGALELFRQRAVRAVRVDADVLHDSNVALLDNLHLADGPFPMPPLTSEARVYGKSLFPSAACAGSGSNQQHDGATPNGCQQTHGYSPPSRVGKDWLPPKNGSYWIRYNLPAKGLLKGSSRLTPGGITSINRLSVHGRTVFCCISNMAKGSLTAHEPFAMLRRQILYPRPPRPHLRQPQQLPVEPLHAVLVPAQLPEPLGHRTRPTGSVVCCGVGSYWREFNAT